MLDQTPTKDRLSRAMADVRPAREIITRECGDFGDLHCEMDFRATGDTLNGVEAQADLCELRLRHVPDSYLSLDREQAVQMAGNAWVISQEDEAAADFSEALIEEDA